MKIKKRAPLLRKKNIKRESRKRQIKLFLKGSFILLLIAGIFLGGRYGLTHLSFFSLQKVNVIGSPKSLSEADIIAKAQVELGSNLFKIDLEEVKKRIQNNSYFKLVSVQRRLPHSLTIEIQEYTPALILNTGRLHYVDQDGDIFKDITDSDDKRDYPILSGIDEEMLATEPAKVKTVLQNALQLKKDYQNLPAYEALGLSEIHYEKNIGFTLYPEKQKYSIKVGLKDFAEKMKKLGESWKQIEESKSSISSIDLNYPGKILMSL